MTEPERSCLIERISTLPTCRGLSNPYRSSQPSGFFRTSSDTDSRSPRDSEKSPGADHAVIESRSERKKTNTNGVSFHRFQCEFSTVLGNSLAGSLVNLATFAYPRQTLLTFPGSCSFMSLDPQELSCVFSWDSASSRAKSAFEASVVILIQLQCLVASPFLSFRPSSNVLPRMPYRFNTMSLHHC